MKSRLFLFSLCVGLLAGCASAPTPDIRRSGAATAETPGAAQTSPLAETEEPESGPRPVIRRGSG